jgi:hypothetical protein
VTWAIEASSENIPSNRHLYFNLIASS